MGKTKRQSQPTVAQKATQNKQQLMVQQSSHSFQGPLPPPSLLQGYNEVVAGAAERLLSMAEQESHHRQQLESAANTANIAAQQKHLQITELQSKAVARSDTIGQLLGFVISLVCVGSSVYLAIIGQVWIAALLAGLPLVGIIRALREKPSGEKSP